MRAYTVRIPWFAIHNTSVTTTLLTHLRVSAPLFSRRDSIFLADLAPAPVRFETQLCACDHGRSDRHKTRLSSAAIPGR